MFELKYGDKVVATITAKNVNSPECDEGVWVELKADDGTKPTLCMIKTKKDDTFGGDWYLGVYRDASDANIVACDVGIVFSKNGPAIQVAKGDKVKIVDLFEMISQFAFPRKEDLCA